MNTAIEKLQKPPLVNKENAQFRKKVMFYVYFLLVQTRAGTVFFSSVDDTKVKNRMIQEDVGDADYNVEDDDDNFEDADDNVEDADENVEDADDNVEDADDNVENNDDEF
jgi:hypothetical protein